MVARPDSIMDYIMTAHAVFEIQRRGLTEAVVRSVLAAPDQRLQVRPGRVVLQSRVSIGHPGTTYLVRVFVDIDRFPAEVVTAYRTSKIGKYWKEEQ